MKRFAKHLLFSLVGLGVVGISAHPAHACKRSWGGGFGFYRSAPVYYQQPVYVAPPPQPFVTQQVPVQQVPLTSQTTVINQQPGAISGQPVSGIQQTQLGGAPQGQAGIAPQGQSTGIAPQGQPTGIAPQGQPTQDGQTGGAQATALQMLSNFGGVPAQAPAPPAEGGQGLGFNNVGTFVATLSNGAVVRLNLQANGAFVWLADSNGRQSTFQGTFNMNGQSLTLTRSNDGQQLAGSLTVTGADSFTFKLNGTQDAGLAFTRQ
jgi:hypothetical protein